MFWGLRARDITRLCARSAAGGLCLDGRDAVLLATLPADDWRCSHARGKRHRSPSPVGISLRVFPHTHGKRVVSVVPDIRLIGVPTRAWEAESVHAGLDARRRWAVPHTLAPVRGAMLQHRRILREGWWMWSAQVCPMPDAPGWPRMCDRDLVRVWDGGRHKKSPSRPWWQERGADVSGSISAVLLPSRHVCIRTDIPACHRRQ